MSSNAHEVSDSGNLLCLIGRSALLGSGAAARWAAFSRAFKVALIFESSQRYQLDLAISFKHSKVEIKLP